MAKEDDDFKPSPSGLLCEERLQGSRQLPTAVVGRDDYAEVRHAVGLVK